MKIKTIEVTHKSYSYKINNEETLYYNGYKENFYYISKGSFKNYCFSEIEEINKLSSGVKKDLLKDMYKFRELVRIDLSRRLVAGDIGHKEKEIETWKRLKEF